MRGRQRIRNRECKLVAWSTYIIASAFGAFQTESFEQFLARFPPPGYDPKA
jgi:hypothetical protein